MDDIKNFAKLDPQAVQLNDVIQKALPSVMDMLSDRGKAIFFPKLGILSQSAAAKGKDINATIGVALEDDGSPMSIGCIDNKVDLPAADMLIYAPSPGRPDLRKSWKNMLEKKNPALRGKSYSLPVVTSALTHGLSICGYMFCDPGDHIIIPDLYWENYDLVFSLAYGAVLDKFPMFDGNASFNVGGLRDKLLSGSVGKKIVCLNFPNNPTGYTPGREEIKSIVSALEEAACKGSRIVVLIDDAYFGLVYENGTCDQSVFADLCDLHANVLAVKLDGPTKEDYVWGFRVGFVTYGIRGATNDMYEALEAKTSGAIRGNISNASNLSQSILASAWASEEYDRQKSAKKEVLKRRYKKVRSVLDSHPEYRKYFVALPFNSGYFMCVRIIGVDPDKLRGKLLEKYSTGVIVLGEVVRIAFSSVPTDRIEDLFANMFNAARELGG